MRQTYKHDLFYSIIATFQAVEERLTKKCLTDEKDSPYSTPTVAKLTAGRGNPVLLHMANDSTPQACFFIRSTNTSKASPKRLDFLNDGVLWARFALDCLPFCYSFSTPLHAIALHREKCKR